MSDGSNDDAGFFVIHDGEAGKPGETPNGGPILGNGVANPSGNDPPQTGIGSSIPGEFSEIKPAPKRRGRPPGSTNRPKSATDAQKDSFGPGLALGSEATDKDLRRQAAALAVAIQQRHLMVALMLGLPELALPPEKAEALAIALINFQNEYPAVKVSRKLTVAIDLATAAGMAYLPAVAAVADRARRSAQARKERGRPGVNYPPVNPQDQPVPATPSEASQQPASNGNAVILASGVPDRGKIDFGPN